MRTSTTKSRFAAYLAARRQRTITVYRYAVLGLLVVTVILLSILVGRSPSTHVTVSPMVPITHGQADKVDLGATFLEDVGFNDPTYLGITPGMDGGRFPTFRVTAVGGKTIDLWIRTTPNGGWEIQPVNMADSVTSADDLARLAQKAVDDWEDIPADIKPRTDGAAGEWEGRKYMYDLLAKYNPPESYWYIRPDQTRGWPAK